jgi:hypothetical protein
VGPISKRRASTSPRSYSKYWSFISYISCK